MPVDIGHTWTCAVNTAPIIESYVKQDTYRTGTFMQIYVYSYTLCICNLALDIPCAYVHACASHTYTYTNPYVFCMCFRYKNIYIGCMIGRITDVSRPSQAALQLAQAWEPESWFWPNSWPWVILAVSSFFVKITDLREPKSHADSNPSTL